MDYVKLTKEMVDEEVARVTRKGDSSGLLWFATEIIQMVAFVMLSLALLWLYAPWWFWGKVIYTLVSMVIVYDVFKNFVYVRWILWKESS